MVDLETLMPAQNVLFWKKWSVYEDDPYSWC